LPIALEDIELTELCRVSRGLQLGSIKRYQAEDYVMLLVFVRSTSMIANAPNL